MDTITLSKPERDALWAELSAHIYYRTDVTLWQLRQALDVLGTLMPVVDAIGWCELDDRRRFDLPVPTELPDRLRGLVTVIDEYLVETQRGIDDGPTEETPAEWDEWVVGARRSMDHDLERRGALTAVLERV